MSAHQILLIEDEPLQRMALTMQFSRAGMPCLDCADGTAALQACAHNYYPMILTDFHLPDMTGADVCREIRTHHHLHNAVVFVMSAWANQDEIDAAFEHGANGFLRKPVSIKQVSQWLNTTFGLR